MNKLVAYLTWLLLSLTPFYLLSQDSDLRLGGWVNADAAYFFSESPSVRQPTFQWRINATPRVSYKGWNLQTLVNIGSFEDRFGQPFNKFGMTGGNHWMQWHLGHRTMNFSPLSLSNHLFLGAGVDLTPGKFRFSAMYGRFNRQVDADSTNVNINPAFKRLGYAMKIGAGRPNNFVDVHIFRAIDDTSSINYFPDYAGVAPEQNFIAGVSVRQRFAHRIYLEIDAAASAYSRDIRSLDVDTDPFFADDLAYQLFQPHTSSQFLGSVIGKLDYRHKDFAAGIGYSLIEPDYQSMGAYFFQNDIERWEAHSRWRVMDRKLSGNIRLTTEHNNLKDNKTTLNTRRSVATGLRYQPGQELMISMNYNGYHTHQSRRDTNQVESVVLNQFTHSVGTMSNIGIGDNDLNISVNIVSRNNQLTGHQDFGSVSTRASYRIGFGEIKVAPSLGYGRFAFGGDNISERYTTGISANKNWEELNATAGFTYILSSLNGTTSNNTYRTHYRMTWMLKDAHRFSLRLMHAFTSSVVGSGINELRIDFGYSFSLSGL